MNIFMNYGLVTLLLLLVVVVRYPNTFFFGLVSGIYGFILRLVVVNRVFNYP